MNIEFVLITVIFLIISGFCWLNMLKIIKKQKDLSSKRQLFLATLVHDLKTPTNAQLNALNMLKNEVFGKLTPQQSEMISLTQESCRYMSGLIGIILDTCRYDTVGLRLKKERFDIVNLVSETCNQILPLCENYNKDIKFQSNLKQTEVFADKLQLERVLINLISNAVKYGQPDSTIFVMLQGCGNRTEFRVESLSRYIPPKELKTIFEKYTQPDFIGYEKTSTGLGLYLSRQIVECHNGKIYAKSYRDGRCIFGFIITSKPSSNKKEKLKTPTM